jgi:hypothetical protein
MATKTDVIVTVQACHDLKKKIMTHIGEKQTPSSTIILFIIHFCTLKFGTKIRLLAMTNLVILAFFIKILMKSVCIGGDPNTGKYDVWELTDKNGWQKVYRGQKNWKGLCNYTRYRC